MKYNYHLTTASVCASVKLCIHELAPMRSLAPAHAEAQGNINSESSTHTRRAHAKTPTLAMLSHTRARAYRMYFKSLMCKQLLLFAQTTCSFWTQTKLLAYVAVC